MERIITYFYPDAKRASSLKMFQDRSSQIKGFSFTKDNAKDIETLPGANDYALYFLLDNSEDEKRIYVGQSTNGVKRIAAHSRKKEFWSHCIMFVTDNSSFDKLIIDFLEYYFIAKLKKSSFVLINKDMRHQEPNVSIYDRPLLMAFIDQIDFLLRAEGVNTEELKEKVSVAQPFCPVETGENTEGSQEEVIVTQYYYPINTKYQAKIFVQDGQFVLAKGSYISRPMLSTKSWGDNGRFYNRLNNLIDDYLTDDKVLAVNDYFETQVNLSFRSPSIIGALISGKSSNGWAFFERIEELRNQL